MITGDIDAMWLRDSSAQVYPYLDFMSEDKNLQRLIIGVINKQTSFILKDPMPMPFMMMIRSIQDGTATIRR